MIKIVKSLDHAHTTEVAEQTVLKNVACPNNSVQDPKQAVKSVQAKTIENSKSLFLLPIVLYNFCKNISFPILSFIGERTLSAYQSVNSGLLVCYSIVGKPLERGMEHWSLL